MHGYTSATKSVVIALNQSRCAQPQAPKDATPVLFVFLMQNYDSLEGFRLSNDSYSAYSYEQEYLLQACLNLHVLSIEKDVLIENYYV